MTDTPERRRLPNRRASEVAEIEVDGLTYTATISRFEDGGLAELFMDGPKIGSAAQIAAREGAILASLCLQSGIGSEVLIHSLERLADDSPAGPIGRALAFFGAAR